MAQLKGTRLSNDWRPSPVSVEFCKGLGLVAHQIDWVRAKFIDYFTGPDACRPVKKDWERAFKNWAERDAWRAKKIQPPESQFTGSDEPLWRARLEGWTRRKFWPVSAGPKPDERPNWVPKHLLQEFKLI